ncbi:MAG TPA: hypothetical protein VF550_19655 [Polyangia bacterium]
MRILRAGFCYVLLALMTHPSFAEAKPNDAVTVRIVPASFREASGGMLAFFDPSQHFHVVITNGDAKSIRLWREQCSWGYANLSFEARGPDGKVAKITKKPRAWEKNSPDWTTLLPGDHLVLDVTFDVAIWQNAPLPASGQQRTVDMKAIFEIAEDSQTKQNHVWTGKVSSVESKYTIFR